jgi:uncharacterized protein YndB with AHSA1/START domain
MNELGFDLERTIVIRAQRETVFRFFTDSNLFADWWGEGSEIHPKVGAAVKIHYPNGVGVSGEILEIEPNEKIVFTYGYDSGQPIPPGASRVTITLRDHSEGTELHLRHEFADASIRDFHVGGWRYQLALFANAVTREQNKYLDSIVDAYLACWGTQNAAERMQRLTKAVSGEVEFHDQYGCTSGIDLLNSHIAAVQQYMPAMKIARDGNMQECQGTAFCRWKAEKPDGSTAGSGLNFFDLTPDGRIKRIVGFWLQ